jgi:hypothetical protein
MKSSDINEVAKTSRKRKHDDQEAPFSTTTQIPIQLSEKINMCIDDDLKPVLSRSRVINTLKT